MIANWNSLAFAGLAAIACLAFDCSPARAQTLSFGYTVPGGSVGVTTGNYSYWGGPGYYGGGYTIVAPGAFVAGPVVPAYVRPPVIVGGPLVIRRPYVVARPYVRYYSQPGYYRRVWR
jgi:hypothetical protein